MSEYKDENGLETELEQLVDIYHKPTTCSKCGRYLKPSGRGRYHCEFCDHYELDDYGKVREYLYVNPGASAMEVSRATGVERRSINQMLKEEKIQTSTGFNPFKQEG